MFNGRHLLFVGLLACAGIVTVHESQQQIRLGYQIAEQEQIIRALRKQVDRERAQLASMLAPARVLERVDSLPLEVRPESDLSIYHAPSDSPHREDAQ